MADWKKELSLVMRDRLAEVGEVTQEDKMRIKELENLHSLSR